MDNDDKAILRAAREAFNNEIQKLPINYLLDKNQCVHIWEKCETHDKEIIYEALKRFIHEASKLSVQYFVDSPERQNIMNICHQLEQMGKELRTLKSNRDKTQLVA